MKYYKNLIFISSLILTNLVYAQLPEINWTEQDKEKKLPYYFVKLNDKIVTFTELNRNEKLKNLLVKVYDSKNKLIKEIEHKNWENSAWKSKNYMLNNVIVIDNKIHLILSKFEKKRMYLYRNELTSDYKASPTLISIGDLGLKNNRVDPSFLTKLMYGRYYSTDADNFVKFKSSNDHSKHVMYTYTQDKGGQYLEALCFDDKFKLIYKTKNKFPSNKYKDEFMQSLLVANNGDLFFNYKKVMSKKILNYKENYVLAKVSDNGKTFKTKEYKDPNDIVDITKQCKFSADETSFIVFEKVKSKKGGKLLGFNLKEVNLSTLESESHQATKINEEMIKQIYTDKKASKINIEKGIYDNYKEGSLHTMSDNSKICVLEYHSIAKHTYSYRSGNSTVTSTTYNHTFGDLLLLKFNPNNELEWSKIIYRKQIITTSTEYCKSMINYQLGNKVYLIYNDNPDNLELQGNSGSESKEKIKKTKNLRNADAVLRSIDFNGVLESMTILKGEESDEILNIHDVRELDRQNVVLTSSKGKKMKLGIMTFHKSMENDIKVQPINENLSSENTENTTIDSKQEMIDNSNMNDLEKSITQNIIEPSTPAESPIPSSEAYTIQGTKSVEEIQKDIVSDDPENYYTIQILSSKDQINQHEYFEKLKNINVVFENGNYNYFIGNFKSKAVSNKFLSYLKSMNIEGTIVHYINNLRSAE